MKTNSQSRLYLPYLLVASFSAIVFLQPIYSLDYWTHLAFGREFVNSLSVNIPEPFLRYVEAGPIDSTEWPFQVLLYLARSTVGDIGISILIALTGIAVFTPIVSLVAADASNQQRYATVALITATICVAQIRFLPRPELLTYLLFSISLLLTFQWVREPNWKPIAIIVALFLVWLPLHISWPVGIVFWAAFLATQTTTQFWTDLIHNKTRRSYVLAVGVVLLCGAVGAGRFAWEVLSGLQEGGRMAGISEMRPVWEFPDVAWQFYLVALFAGIFSGISPTGRRSRLLLWAMALVLGSIVVRNVAFALIVMLFNALSGLRPVQSRRVRHAAAKLALPLASAIIAFMFAYALTSRDYDKIVGLRQALFPMNSATLILEHGLATPIFNNFDSGGYLNWAWRGSIKTFIDGRALGGADLLRDHHEIIEAEKPEALFDEHDIHTVVTHAAYFNSGRTFPIIAWLLRNPNWSLVGAADGLVFTRGPVPAEVPALPDRHAWLYVLAYIAELEKINNDMPHAGFSRGIAYFYLGEDDLARSSFSDAGKAHPLLLQNYRHYIQALDWPS
jgi:hypothetical protein